jgi:sporulation protein YlmC with PRC-barrel domain
MRLSLLTAGTALLLCQSVAMAQTNTHPTRDTTAEPSANATTGTPGSVGSQMRDSLQKAGFSNIRMVPSSFVISAMDKAGNPVVMTVTPESFTEVTEESRKGSKSVGPGPEDSAAASSGSDFVSVANKDELSSKLIGLDIYNSANQDVGQIKDIAMSQHGRAQAYIVSVGGFLGMGERYVAVNPSAITVTYSESDKKWHAAMDATADQLKAAPEFKYNGRWSGSRS